MSNHLSTDPRPAWTTLPPSTHNSINGVHQSPNALVSYTPILTIRVARNINPPSLSLYFESYPTSHLFPLVTVLPSTRQVIIKFRHSSFHRGLLGLFDDEVSMGGPVKEQYVMTTTKHEFLLPEGFSCSDWSWRKFRAGGSAGGGGRDGTHVLEVTFYSEEEEFEDAEEGGVEGEEWVHDQDAEEQEIQADGNGRYEGYYGKYVYEEGDAQMDIDMDTDKSGSDLLVFD